MSNESRKRTKEWLGKSPSIVLGQDVLSEETAAVSGAVGHTLLGNVAIHTAHKPGLVDGFVVNVYPAVTSGQIDVAMSVAGAVKASGAISLATNSREVSWFWSANKNNEVALASGNAIEMQYAISDPLNDDGVTSYYIQGRALISYTE